MSANEEQRKRSAAADLFVLKLNFITWRWQLLFQLYLPM